MSGQQLLRDAKLALGQFGFRPNSEQLRLGSLFSSASAFLSLGPGLHHRGQRFTGEPLSFRQLLIEFGGLDLRQQVATFDTCPQIGMPGGQIAADPGVKASSFARDESWPAASRWRSDVCRPIDLHCLGAHTCCTNDRDRFRWQLLPRLREPRPPPRRPTQAADPPSITSLLTASRSG